MSLVNRACAANEGLSVRPAWGVFHPRKFAAPAVCSLCLVQAGDRPGRHSGGVFPGKRAIYLTLLASVLYISFVMTRFASFGYWFSGYFYPPAESAF